jgi:pimeloyl-ACP methyl ester carboxylesterase
MCQFPAPQGDNSSTLKIEDWAPKIEDLATHFSEKLDLLEYEQITIVGWSFGGVLAFETAEKMNKKPAAVVLIDVVALPVHRDFAISGETSGADPDQIQELDENTSSAKANEYIIVEINASATSDLLREHAYGNRIKAADKIVFEVDADHDSIVLGRAKLEVCKIINTIATNRSNS